MKAALAELAAIASAMADPQRTLDTLIGETGRLQRLMEQHCALSLTQVERMRDGESFLPSGWAISPVQAALCAREPYRTAAFIQGLALAVQERLQADRPVRVLYAGCGPFALLAMPLMALFTPSQVQFCILEVHAETLDYARGLIGKFGYSGHVGDFFCADAAEFRIPAQALPDVIVSETMNTALGKEPQVTIMRNLHGQAPQAALVPSAVTVHLGMDRPRLEEPCTDFGLLFTLDAPSMQAWQQDRNAQGDSLPAATLRLPDMLEREPRLLTRIRVYRDIVLGDYHSSLNLPLRLPGKPKLDGGTTLAFHYRLGAQPGLDFRIV